MVEAMDLVSQSIRIPDEVDHIDVMGTSDQFLRLLEKGFPATRLSVSGRSVQLQGPADEVPLVAGVVEEMIAAAVEGAPLDGNTIAEAVQILRSPERPKPLLTAGGKYVRAKTPGQQRYLDDLESHQITFGIGPAGTGKTYLAMAKAVEALLSGAVRRLILTRPAVEAGENLGYLPGSLTDKIDPYLRPLYDALQDQPRTYAIQVLQCIDRLQKIADDMLSLKYLEAGQTDLHLELCAVDEVVQQVVNSYRPLARERERSRQLERALIQLQDEVLTNNLPPTMKQTK